MGRRKNDVSRKKRTSERNEKNSWELISILFIATFMLGSLPFLNIDLSTSEVAAESFFGMGFLGNSSNSSAESLNTNIITEYAIPLKSVSTFSSKSWKEPKRQNLMQPKFSPIHIIDINPINTTNITSKLRTADTIRTNILHGTVQQQNTQPDIVLITPRVEEPPVDLRRVNPSGNNDRDRKLFFLHFHKAGGTSICHQARTLNAMNVPLRNCNGPGDGTIFLSVACDVPTLLAS